MTSQLSTGSANDCLTFMHKVVKGLVPAMPAGTFFIPPKQGCQIRSSRIKDFVSRNLVENYIQNNDRLHTVLHSNTEQYKHSFFSRTVIAWNCIDNSIVHSESTDCFKSALAAAKRTSTTTAAHPNPSHQCQIPISKQCTLKKQKQTTDIFMSLISSPQLAWRFWGLTLAGTAPSHH